jgi:beta-glucosidase-like glycosyl hydrolase
VANVFVSAHDLEDTYLPAFRAAIVDARAGSVMCAYNRINGQPACASELLLKQTLRGAWGFKGYVVSDCDAVTDISIHSKYATDPAAAAAVALKAGTDNECNTQTLGDTPGLGQRYRQAYERGLIGMADIDQALVRLFSARLRNGDLAGMPGREANAVPVGAIDTPEHRALALKAAIESLVLLKNDGVLPLKAGARIAVVGPLADATRVLRGNYSSTQSAAPVSGHRRPAPRLAAGADQAGPLRRIDHRRRPGAEIGLPHAGRQAGPARRVLQPERRGLRARAGRRTRRSGPGVARAGAEGGGRQEQGGLDRRPGRARNRHLSHRRERRAGRADGGRQAGRQGRRLFALGRAAQAGRGHAREGPRVSAALPDRDRRDAPSPACSGNASPGTPRPS